MVDLSFRDVNRSRARRKPTAYEPDGRLRACGHVRTAGSSNTQALYETGRADDPHKLVFFEVFSAAAAHEFHVEQDYTKRMFASLGGKVSGVDARVFSRPYESRLTLMQRTVALTGWRIAPNDPLIRRWAQ
jgi:hypothetical protein